MVSDWRLHSTDDIPQNIRTRPTLLDIMTQMSVTARVSELAVSNARLYVRYILLLGELFTLAPLPYGVSLSTIHPGSTRSLPSYRTLQYKSHTVHKLSAMLHCDWLIVGHFTRYPWLAACLCRVCSRWTLLDYGHSRGLNLPSYLRASPAILCTFITWAIIHWWWTYLTASYSLRVNRPMPIRK